MSTSHFHSLFLGLVSFGIFLVAAYSAPFLCGIPAKWKEFSAQTSCTNVWMSFHCLFLWVFWIISCIQQSLKHIRYEHFPDISMTSVGLVLGIQATEDEVSIHEANFSKVVEHFFSPFLTFPLDKVAAKKLIKMSNSSHKLVILICGNWLQ